MSSEDKSTILVVDDNPDNVSLLVDYLGHHHLKVLVARDGESAIRQVKFAKPDIILLDVMMPGLSGFDTCERLKKDEDTKDIPILFITALTDTIEKVKGLRIGAVDFVTKPIQHEEVLARVTTHLKISRLQKELTDANSRLEERVAEKTSELLHSNHHLKNALAELERLKNQLQAENIYLREELKREHNFEEIVYQCEGLKRILDEVGVVATTDATVLVLGETGTGKELIARALHNNSLRKDKAFVKVNCAALPANLVESELFGHEKGAFTGAFAQNMGRFELADGGTIFLDEIGDFPLELQAKLLRVLQDGEFERVGNPQTLKVDIRVIAATNKDLKSAIKSGSFREDLYYRLSVIPISLPPLRDRKEDIILLAKHFVNRDCTKLGKRIDTISPKTIEVLQAYSWPGNIRELENVIERAVILSHGTTLKIDDLEDPLDHSDFGNMYLSKAISMEYNSSQFTLEEVERNHIINILETCNWVIEGKKGAASILAINPSTLRSRMKKLGIKYANI